MHPARLLLTAGVAAARAIVTLIVTLGFWAAAPLILGWMPTTVMTASMSPAIEVGDVVVARPVPREALVAGRVVLATDPDWPDRLRLHRIAALDDRGDLVTKGDANPSADSSPLHPDAVHGVGVLRVPFVGLPIVWVRSGDVVPLAACVLAFAGCLALALRRGDEDEETDADHPPPPAPSASLTRRALRTRALEKPDADTPPPPLTRRALRTRARAGSARQRRRTARSALALTAITALVATAVATPASAGFHADATTSGSVTAGRVTAPWALECSSGLFSNAVIFWSYDGWQPRSFDILADGYVIVRDIAPGERAVRLPSGSWPILGASRVTVRVNVGQRWTAESGGVAISGTLFGRPYCS
ncbi:S24/S26 family peptidase [Microbacterium sp. PRF11]|uniref:S24/S26 family peptidase n=1 Tax=Microbacterium sp. PRF11 TaxID=2962593 RepID=UPI002880D5B0|nr:S24/S26 family peptidase [Microbacterium sp. PRF11]MDT0116989.1 S24/S26 family peptidase [Microbacterium sp. PRF11]